MTVIEYWDHSRILKAVTDNSEVPFDEARQKLQSVKLAVVVAASAARTAAGAACLLTAVNAAGRTFGTVTVVGARGVEAQRPFLEADSLQTAVQLLGGTLASAVPADATHVVAIGDVDVPSDRFCMRCFWSGWRAGVRKLSDVEALGDGTNALAGVYAGTLAVREAFANMLGRRFSPRSSTVSLWTPWDASETEGDGPRHMYLPTDLTLVGLGHLGQGFLWSLLFLPMTGRLVLWDYQRAGVENVPTGLLTIKGDVGDHKTRIAARRMEAAGWKTDLVERKFLADNSRQDSDPALVITALDSPLPREHVLGASYPYMLDIGVGHGPVDFDSAQLRCFASGDPSSWGSPSVATSTEGLLRRTAYQRIAALDSCGAYELASASVAVPFVGAALGALAVAQALRLGAMESVPRLMQIELSAPEMVTLGAMTGAPSSSLGTSEFELPK